jgi:hypothetical protein
MPVRAITSLLEIISECMGEVKMLLPPEEITAGESFLTSRGGK